MIIRVFRVKVQEGKTEEFREFFLSKGIPLTKSQPGLVSLTAGLPRPETPDEFCLVMVWQDLASMKAFVGEDWQSAHIHPDEAGMVRERTISHYELVAE